METVTDRTIATIGDTEYIAVIHYEQDADNPITAWDMAERFRPTNAAGHVARIFGNSDDFPGYWEMEGKIPARYLHAIDDAQYEADGEQTAAWLAALRRYDPSGVYRAFSYGLDTSQPWLHLTDDDSGNGIVYVTSAAIRKEQICKHITAKVRATVEKNIESTIATLRAWINGDVFGWELLRQTLDDDGEVLESESLDSVWGYYGWEEHEYMFSEATASAQYHIKTTAEAESAAFEAMDLFAAAA